MDPPPGFPSPENPSPTTTRRELQIQGPRPSPLRVSRGSHKISKKPPMAPPLRQALQPPQQAPLRLPENGNQPIIIYSVSPKPIFVEASNFRSIVQHLTGRDSCGTYESSFSGEIPVSPAARVASIERTSPKEGDWRERRSDIGGFADEILMSGCGFSGGLAGGSGGIGGGDRNLGFDVVDISQNPGILSPAPVNLPAISAGMFSPVVESNQLVFGFGEGIMSPFFGASISPTMFLSNASTIFSPSPSLGELFNFDF